MIDIQKRDETVKGIHSREESGDRSRKGKNENRINTQRADRSKRSALKICGAEDKEEQSAKPILFFYKRLFDFKNNSVNKGLLSVGKITYALIIDQSNTWRL